MTKHQIFQIVSSALKSRRSILMQGVLIDRIFKTGPDKYEALDIFGRWINMSDNPNHFLIDGKPIQK